MSNQVIKQETAISLFGIEARAFNVIADPEAGVIRNQKIGATRYFEAQGKRYQISVELRYDDECKNGHNTFAITGDIYGMTASGRASHVAGGCIHGDIAEHFPELAHLIKWHLCNDDGPHAYIANTTYLAGNRDCWGRAAGDPASFVYGVRFNSVPALHMMKESLWNWLRERDGQSARYTCKQVENTNDITGNGYKYPPKFTLSYLNAEDFATEWYKCPFDSEAECQAFADALNEHLSLEFVKVPATFSEGKARELDGARSTAIWPEATDEQLMLPKAELTALLEARLPALLEAFKSDVEACGFIYSL